MPTVLVATHSILVLLLAVSIATSTDTEAVIGWIIPYHLDYPASLLVSVFDMQMPAFFLITGVVYWGIIGTAMQRFWRWLTHRYAKAPEANEPVGKNEFRWFGCGGAIREQEEACTKCGWTWKLVS